MRSLTKVRSCSKGFTLVEIIVSLAIVGIIVPMAYSFLSFGSRMFVRSSDTFFAQNNIRTGINTLALDLKYATQLSLIDPATAEQGITNGVELNYVFVRGQSLVRADWTGSGHSLSVLAENLADTNEVFNRDGHTFDQDGDALLIAVNAASGRASYQVFKQVKFENFGFKDIKESIGGDFNNSGAISFRLPADTFTYVPVESITISGAAPISVNGGTLKLTATVSPGNATDRTVDWSVDDEALASIGFDGTLQALSNGTVTVFAGAGEVTEFVTIEITNQDPDVPTVKLVETIIVSGEGGVSAINVFQGTLQMLANVLPIDADNRGVDWSVSNINVAEIDQFGVLRAKGNGTVLVTAKAQDPSGVSGSTNITVTNQVLVVPAGLYSLDSNNPSVLATNATGYMEFHATGGSGPSNYEYSYTHSGTGWHSNSKDNGDGRFFYRVVNQSNRTMQLVLTVEDTVTGQSVSYTMYFKTQ